MDHATFVAHVRADADLIADLAVSGLDRPVPTCPGWSVHDVVEHTAQVFMEKALIMRDGREPDLPPDLGPGSLVEQFAAARDAVLDELGSRDPADRSVTWFADDQTVGFWGRRMAHEAAIHRLDVEIALEAVTPVDAALAVDGVDEVLRCFLAGDWSDEPVPDGAGTVVELRTGDRAWRVVLEPKAVAVVTPKWGLPADATVSGGPPDLYRWAWGRGEASGLVVDGDVEALHLLRARLVKATQ